MRPLLLLLAACGPPPCDLTAGVVPACGEALGGEALRLGDSRDHAEARLGAPDLLTDLGPLGVRFSWSNHQIAGFYGPAAQGEAVTEIVLLPGFAGRTAEGLGPGSSSDSVRSALGDPEVDPFLGSWWYAGIGFEWREGAVERVHVVAAAKDQ